MVLKGVCLCCYTACCLGSGCPIHVVWWCTAELVAFLHWLSGGWEHLEPLQWCSSPVDLCLLGFNPMVLKEFTTSPWSASGSWPGPSAMSNGLERSCCLCLGCMGNVLLGSMVNSPLLRSMGISPLAIGISLGSWGSLGLSVCWLLGSVLLGLDLSSCAGLAYGEFFSPSTTDFFSEMKL